ncbi:hypothetical protein F4782DRAFT_462126 [Xylaria castorea]|nr:hypothetical protein F4782DRAFT_462126 [Xylaria castorea]
MPGHAEYSVGWICAVENELVAARALLDEEHVALDHIPVRDNNSYTLGRLGKHNVVIAVMPHWQYGHVSAANAARDRVRSFPNVRIGLMVGIGAGAPSAQHDIRLGDVVVCSPGYENGGVFQFDYGKTIQDESFTTTGYLNQPPQFMLTAISALKANYKLHGHNFNSTIQAILEKNQRLQSDYCRPDPDTDKLYNSEWKHAGSDGEKCEAVCGNDSLKFRPERSDHEDNPKIHYGLIASANQLIQNAIIRDKLSAEKGVLCFEMEAAGLMNHFPCLVIRGICDYADTHKNLLWQGYATMTAAAYAKDLLSMIAPNKIEAQRRLGEVLLEVQGDVRKMNTDVRDLRADVHFDHIIKWLAPPDPSTNYNNALRLRHPGSGKWFLDHAMYSNWKFKNKSFLWLHGIPGCGKTILSSIIIEVLSNAEFNQGLFYFYFDFSDTRKQSLNMMLRSLISQLCDRNKVARSRLDSLYSCNQGMRQPSLELLQATFIDMVQEVKAVWIILDALDECPTRTEYPTGGLLSWIQSLQNSQVNTHIIITSRPEQDIEASIKSWARGQDIIPIQNDLLQEDIGAYIGARVREHGILKERWCNRSDIQDMIERALNEKANGMFRWAACQLDELEKCLGPPQVRETLAKLPKTLDETYARIIANLPSENLLIATRLFQFLTYSKRPLLLEEAVDCIAVDTRTQRFDPEDRIPVPKEISRYCSSLVVIVNTACDNKERTATAIQLAHCSVKDYFVSNRLPPNIAEYLVVEAASESITNVCLTYLLRIPQNNPDRQLYPLARYAAQYWVSHAVAANNSRSLVTPIVDCFDCQTLFEDCYRLYPMESWITDKREAPHCPYYAALVGLNQVIQTILDNGANVDAKGGRYGNALQAASFNGHEDIVQMLLNSGANVNAQGGRYRNALQAASFLGHKYIVQMLVKHGADRSSYSGALEAASEMGYPAIVRILEEATNASTDAQSTQEDLDTSADPIIQTSCDTGNPARSDKRSIEPEKTIEPPQKRSRTSAE